MPEGIGAAYIYSWVGAGPTAQAREKEDGEGSPSVFAPSKGGNGQPFSGPIIRPGKWLAVAAPLGSEGQRCLRAYRFKNKCVFL